jgi:prepilin-type N-terminal cleavage/methylation domain-containing protein/prepilin-type processing-associated H-X9-DG protein
MTGRGGRGFTLIELMVVITVIGVLMAFLLPALMKARGVGDLTRCASNLKQLAVGFAVYRSVWGDCFPPKKTDATWNNKSWADLVRVNMGPSYGTMDDDKKLVGLYNSDEWSKWQLFDCPANDQRSRGGGRFDYAYNVKCENRNYNTLRAPDMILVHCGTFYAPDPVNGREANPGVHENGFDNYLFCDGHVQPSNSFYKKSDTGPPWLAEY